MKTLILLALVALVASDDLRTILKSPVQTIKLYSDFKSTEHLHYGRNEDKLRFRLFRANAKFVAAANVAANHMTTFTLNFLSTMTSREQERFLGLNITGHQPNAFGVKTSLESVPRTKLWTDVGAVTSVKNQRSCGSCWAFGAVGGLETRYQQLSGRLRNFAEQEYLDCVYEMDDWFHMDGCNGGWPDRAYAYSIRNGRLAATSDYPYVAADRDCRKERENRPNSLIAYKITGQQHINRGEAANIAALASGSLSVVFQATRLFRQYSYGILRDSTCSGSFHAVTAVGYTPLFVLVKNSWGRDWGDDGFVKFSRNYGNCGLFDYSSYPVLERTGEEDSGPDDRAVQYPKCDDASWCKVEYCKYEQYAMVGCKKMCNRCGPEDGAHNCPAGTNICSDGVCRDEEICKPKCENDPDYSEEDCEGGSCKNEMIANEWCKKTCNRCGDGPYNCPSDTIICSDGVCREEDMC